jgi:uncharacterized membrane-anchored protein
VINDPDLNLAMFEAVTPIVGAAYEFCDRLPAITTDAFIRSPLVVRQATLLVAGIAAVHRTEPSLLSRDDYPGGRFHRQHVLEEYDEILRRRWPPHGDRDEWVRYGPAGAPSTTLESEAAA